MRDIRRRRLHRCTFVAAGLYNLAWGLLSAVYPQWFFTFAGMEPPRYPEIFACLGMVIGLYGILYFQVALFPERSWLIVAVGLAGKVLGPIGLAVLIFQGRWPLRALILTVTNDLPWLIPFGLYLYDVFDMTRQGREDSCTCMTPPFHHSEFESAEIGVDETKGRFGEVTIEKCKRCSRKWLRYFVEYEAFPKSGRWYRGLISHDIANTITPQSAVEILEGLDWYFYGGSYFETAGKKGSGPIFVDL